MENIESKFAKKIIESAKYFAAMDRGTCGCGCNKPLAEDKSYLNEVLKKYVKFI
jgi:hypothetical protein